MPDENDLDDLTDDVARALDTPCGHTKRYDADEDLQVDEPLSVGECDLCRPEKIAAALRATADSAYVYGQQHAMSFERQHPIMGVPKERALAAGLAKLEGKP